MTNLRYFLMMSLILIAELTLVFIFFIFATQIPFLYVIFSLLFFLSLIGFLVYSRYREKIKIKPKAEVLKSYRNVAFIVIGICVGAFLFVSIFTALFILFSMNIFIVVTVVLAMISTFILFYSMLDKAKGWAKAGLTTAIIVLDIAIIIGSAYLLLLTTDTLAVTILNYRFHFLVNIPMVVIAIGEIVLYILLQNRKSKEKAAV